MKINASFDVSKYDLSFCSKECQFFNQIDENIAYCELFDKNNEWKLGRYFSMDNPLNDGNFKAIRFECHIKCK
jgi:hypothetical protein